MCDLADESIDVHGPAVEAPWLHPGAHMGHTAKTQLGLSSSLAHSDQDRESQRGDHTPDKALPLSGSRLSGTIFSGVTYLVA
jgi:hypothetical protein